MKRTHTGGYVDQKLVVSIAIAIVLGVTLYFFSPGFWANFGQRPIVAGDSISVEQENAEGASGAGYSVYFSNPSLGSSENCDEVFPVARTVGPNREADALLALFSGPTEAEKGAGFTSFFSASTADALKSIGVRNGVAAVNLSDIRNIIPGVSSSCGSAQFLSSIGATLMQFKSIKKVVYAIDGNPSIFYEWVQLGCSEDNLQCDPSLFR